MRIIIWLYAHAYLIWGSLYRFFERIVYSKKYNKSKKSIRAMLTENGITPREQFDYLLRRIEYTKDKWWQFWDVISDPVCTLIRGRGDCDDYAATGAWILGNIFDFGGRRWRLQGLYCLIWKIAEGHCIAVWKSESDESYIVISTENQFQIYHDFEQIFTNCYEYNDQKIKFGALFLVQPGKKFGLKYGRALMRGDIFK